MTFLEALSLARRIRWVLAIFSQVNESEKVLGATRTNTRTTGDDDRSDVTTQET